MAAQPFLAAKTYELGANSFATKPTRLEDGALFAMCLKDDWLGFNEPPSEGAS